MKNGYSDNNWLSYHLNKTVGRNGMINFLFTDNHSYTLFILFYQELNHLIGIIFAWMMVDQVTHYEEHVEIVFFFESGAGEAPEMG